MRPGPGRLPSGSCSRPGPEHPYTLWSRHNLATAHANLGRHQEALDLDEETQRLRGRVLGPEHPDTRWSRHNLDYYHTRLRGLRKGRALGSRLVGRIARFVGR